MIRPKYDFNSSFSSPASSPSMKGWRVVSRFSGSRGHRASVVSLPGGAGSLPRYPNPSSAQVRREIKALLTAGR
jgi:hypothetical protein